MSAEPKIRVTIDRWPALGFGPSRFTWFCRPCGFGFRKQKFTETVAEAFAHADDRHPVLAGSPRPEQETSK